MSRQICAIYVKHSVGISMYSCKHSVGIPLRIHAQVYRQICQPFWKFWGKSIWSLIQVYPHCLYRTREGGDSEFQAFIMGTLLSYLLFILEYLVILNRIFTSVFYLGFSRAPRYLMYRRRTYTSYIQVFTYFFFKCINMTFKRDLSLISYHSKCLVNCYVCILLQV